MSRPTTHDDLRDTYNARATEFGCGFLLAGELGEASKVQVGGLPALGARFRLLLPAVAWGYIELDWASCELPLLGCVVTYYKVPDLTPSLDAIEAAFLKLARFHIR